MFAVDLVNLLDQLEAGGDATVHREVFLRNIAADWHCIENLHEQVVDFNVEALHDLVPKCERLRHIS